MSTLLARLTTPVGQYLVVTGNYWAFTLTDGALRMLVVLYFHQLGYSPIEVALLFLFYEIFGVVTNLVGGWLGARLGLNVIMNVGLAAQIGALSMLLVPPDMLSVVWVMAAQALSGIAKDLNKMSAKSSIKALVPQHQKQQLFRWVALLTGSKNTLKGVGFFVGGLLLSLFGFQTAILIMAAVLSVVWIVSLLLLRSNTNPSKYKPKFKDIFSNSSAINTLALARLFLFGARDVWFVVALPVYLSQFTDWTHMRIGAFFAIWVIIYGVIQSFAPKLIGAAQKNKLVFWSIGLTVITAALAVLIAAQFHAPWSLVIGLLIFALFFAVNSSLHSFLIVHYARSENTSLDVGFYYMANAGGRLIGTVLSGVLFQTFGLTACLMVATLFLVITTSVSIKLP